ncbi:hypothetical protein ACM66B_000578 [Microbotryomycetes sp. NB124-2]
MAQDDALNESTKTDLSAVTDARDATAPRRDRAHPTPPTTAPLTKQSAEAPSSSAIKPIHGSQVPSPAAMTASQCRLLWRGRLIDSSTARPLYGVAIIAHLFAITSAAASPFAASQQQIAQLSPFDDPFSPNTSSSGADMCLGIEMQRGADLRITGEVQVTCQSSSSSAPAAASKDRPTVEVETPTDVRVFIDPRCHDTVAWFEDMFCRQGREGLGVRLDVAGEDIVIMASLPVREPDLEPELRPELSLLLGRVRKQVVRVPRPDDPMPRENLFASKLRQSMSLPTLDYDKRTKPSAQQRQQVEYILNHSKSRPLVPGIKSKRQAQAFLTLMGNKPTRDPNSRAQSVDLAEFPTKRATGLQRSSSVYDLSTRIGPSGGHSQVTAGRGPLKRSRSVMTGQVSPPMSPPPARQHSRRPSSRAHGSPTPSISTSFGDLAADEDVIKGEEDDTLGDLGAPSKRASTHSPTGRKSLSRSASLPVGSFGEALQGKAEYGATEARNKQSIRKLVNSQMAARGVGRDDAQFKDVFGMTCKGVQFALRHSLKVDLVDKPAATALVNSHLDMYLVSSSPEPSPVILKQEGTGRQVSVAPVSPRSLEIDEDVEMTQTQIV